MVKRFLVFGLAIVGLGLVGLVVPAFAQEGDAVTDRPISTQANDGTGTNDAAASRAQRAATQARERATQIREQAQERRAQVLTEVCERREQRLNQLIPRLSQGATSLLGAMDTVYERVQGFYESGQLAVENYDELKANVDAAQTEATAAVQALQDYEFSLNCDDPEAGSQLDSFRLAVGEAKESLRQYRTELSNLINAMRAAAASSTDDPEDR